MIILDTPTLTGRMHANCPVRAEALGRHVSCDFALQHDPAMQQFARYRNSYNSATHGGATHSSK